MGKLPVLSGSDVCKALCNKDGFYKDSQTGGQVKLKKHLDDRVLTTIVPNHKELSIGVLKSIINQKDHTNKSFTELFN
jgi:predicted RNA binding protein YcfA (HicA-like mRNA interferase family)